MQFAIDIPVIVETVSEAANEVESVKHNVALGKCLTWPSRLTHI